MWASESMLSRMRQLRAMSPALTRMVDTRATKDELVRVMIRITLILLIRRVMRGCFKMLYIRNIIMLTLLIRRLFKTKLVEKTLLVTNR